MPLSYAAAQNPEITAPLGALNDAGQSMEKKFVELGHFQKNSAQWWVT
jgi:hypothetical protein